MVRKWETWGQRGRKRRSKKAISWREEEEGIGRDAS